MKNVLLGAALTAALTARRLMPTNSPASTATPQHHAARRFSRSSCTQCRQDVGTAHGRRQGRPRHFRVENDTRSASQ